LFDLIGGGVRKSKAKELKKFVEVAFPSRVGDKGFLRGVKKVYKRQGK
jgi:hypothetical protein